MISVDFFLFHLKLGSQRIVESRSRLWWPRVFIWIFSTKDFLCRNRSFQQKPAESAIMKKVWLPKSFIFSKSDAWLKLFIFRGRNGDHLKSYVYRKNFRSKKLNCRNRLYSKITKNQKNWLLPLTGESLLVFWFLKKSVIMSLPGCQSTFPPSNFTRSLAFEFLRAGYSVHMAITIRSEPCILSLVTAQILAINFNVT